MAKKDKYPDLCKVFNEYCRRELNKDWNPKNFHSSMLGKCPRANVFQMAEAEKLEQTKAQVQAKNQTFLLGLLAEDVVVNSMADRRWLLGHNTRVPNDKHPKWTGTNDITIQVPKYGMGVVEVKSVHPNAFNYQDNFPYEHNVLQMLFYLYGWKNGGFPCNMGALFYMSRGGGAEPLEFWYQANESNEMRLEAAIKEVEDAWCDFVENGELPPILDRQEKFKYDKKKAAWALYLEPNWWCKTRCDYAGAACDPNLSTNKVLEIREGQTAFRAEYKEYKVKDRKRVIELKKKTNGG
jgi:hypothetical protein